MKRRIGYVALRHAYLFAAALLSAFALSQLLVVATDLISESINLLTAGGTIKTSELLARAGIITILSMVVAFSKSMCQELFSIKVQKDCKTAIIESLESIQYRYFESSAGAFMNKLTSDITDIGSLVSEVIPEILQYVATIIVLGMALIKIDKYIFLGIVAVFPVAVFLSDIIAKKINDLAKKRKGKYDELYDIALDNISGIEVARAYRAEEFLGKRVDLQAAEILSNEYARNRYQALANGLTSLIKWIPTIVCSLIALWLTIKGVINFGELMAFLVLFGKISSPLSELPFRMIDARELIISVGRAQKLINLPRETSGNHKSVCDEDNVIRFENVSFSYEDGTDNVLDNISMTANKGEVVAIVGVSGSGKSTLMKLLCGFYGCRMGKYCLCGRSMDEWDMGAARNLISYVPQEAYLFPCSILENVAYGDGKIDEERVWAACEKAGIAEMILALPEGYHTEVGERGVKLSGGERQRLAIARAFYKNAPIILLDEPTSALDEETEKIIGKTIYGDKNKTVIVIAHRLSTIKDANRIYCMKEGRIVEEGTHEELLRMGGAYSALYSKEVQGQ